MDNIAFEKQVAKIAQTIGVASGDTGWPYKIYKHTTNVSKVFKLLCVTLWKLHI